MTAGRMGYTTTEVGDLVAKIRAGGIVRQKGKVKRQIA